MCGATVNGELGGVIGDFTVAKGGLAGVCSWWFRGSEKRFGDGVKWTGGRQGGSARVNHNDNF